MLMGNARSNSTQGSGITTDDLFPWLQNGSSPYFFGTYFPYWLLLHLSNQILDQAMQETEGFFSFIILEEFQSIWQGRVAPQVAAVCYWGLFLEWEAEVRTSGENDPQSPTFPNLPSPPKPLRSLKLEPQAENQVFKALASQKLQIQNVQETKNKNR